MTRLTPAVMTGPAPQPVTVDAGGRVFVRGVEIRARFDPATQQLSFPAKHLQHAGARPVVGATLEEIVSGCRAVCGEGSDGSFGVVQAAPRTEDGDPLVSDLPAQNNVH